MLKFFLGIITMVFLNNQSFCQELIENADVEFISNSQKLSNPLAGGLDNPIFSEADLNNDGYEDLYIFDFNSIIASCFLAILDNNASTSQK